jgi:hypothetical protein
MQVTHSNFDSTIEITIEAAERAKGGDSSYSDIISDQVDEASVVLALREEMMALGPGTGQLAIVRSNTINSDSFVCALNDSGVGGYVKLSEGQPIDFADAATGGTVQETSVITNIANDTSQVITIADDLSLTAGWSVFQRGTYGRGVPAGLDYIVDDGSISPTIFNQLRDQSSKLQGIVVGDDDSLVPYSEDIVDDMLTRISMSSDMTPTYLLVDVGIALEHRLYAGKDRLFPYTNPGPMPATTGGKTDNLTYQFDSSIIPFKINKRVAPRVLYAIYQPSIMKAYLRRPDWVRTGGAEGYPTLALKPAGDTLSFVLTGDILSQWGMMCDMFNANGKCIGIRDRRLAGDPA